MTGYKAFKPDWSCRHKQYVVGSLYEEPTDAFGMCFCTHPADVLAHYPFLYYEGRPAKYAGITATNIVQNSNYTRTSYRAHSLHVDYELSFQELCDLSLIATAPSQEHFKPVFVCNNDSTGDAISLQMHKGIIVAELTERVLVVSGGNNYLSIDAKDCTIVVEGPFNHAEVRGDNNIIVLDCHDCEMIVAGEQKAIIDRYGKNSIYCRNLSE